MSSTGKSRRARLKTNMSQTNHGKSPQKWPIRFFVFFVFSSPLRITSLEKVMAAMLETMSVLTEEDVTRTLSKYLEKNPGRITNYVLSPKNDSGLGYMGIHLDLSIDYVGEDGLEKREKFFVKTYNFNEREICFLDESGIFKKEVDFYDVIFEDVRKYAGSVTWCPKYCFSKPRVLVLEDLSEKGFVMAKGGLTLDEEHVRLALATLASMHASSFTLERKLNTNCLPSKYHPVFRELLYIENRPDMATSKWVSWQIQDLMVGIEMLEKYTEEEKETIKRKFPAQMMRIYPFNKQSTRFRNVLTHGDVWKNNLMFRYDDSGMPSECRLVDFQFFRYAPPAHDVMNFLHLTTRKALRDASQNSLLLHYHDCLRKELEAKNLRVEDELKLDEFLEMCDIYKELALIQSLFSNHYILGPVNLKVKYENYEQYNEYLINNRINYMKDFFAEKSYADKVTECLYELIDSYIMKR